MIKGKLVCDLWTDLIGPSVCLAEVTSLLAYKIYDIEKEPIKILDLFSGSGAVAMATIKAFDRVENNISNNISIVCIDKNEIEIPDSFKNFKKRVIRFRTDIFELIGRKSSFFKQDFDVVVADPPHFLTLDLLYKIVNDEAEIGSNQQFKQERPLSFLRFLSGTGSIFVLYYAHKEQERLSFFIIRRLGMFWPQVYNLRIGDEKIAICIPERFKDKEAVFKTYFKELNGSLLKDYNIPSILILDKYNIPLTLSNK